MVFWNNIDVDFIRLLFLNIEASKITRNILPIRSNNKSNERFLIVIIEKLLLLLLIVNIDVWRIDLKNRVRVIPAQNGLILLLC